MTMPEKIPPFNTIDEARRFWDSKSPADFDDQMLNADDVFEKQETSVVSIRLESIDLEKVKKLAKSKGLGHTTLIRMWIKERLGTF